MLIQQQYTPLGGSGEGWTTARTLTLAEWEATSGSFDFTPPTTKRRQQGTSWPYANTVAQYSMGFRVVATDTAARVTTTGELAKYTKPYGTLHIVPVDDDSYLTTGSWGGLSSHGCRVGDYTSVGGAAGQNWNVGCYFYGATGISDLCAGYTPASGSVYVQRYSSMGTSGTWYVQPHDRGSASGAPSFSGTLYGAAISGTDDFENCAFPAGWLTDAVAGTTMKGLGLVKNGSTSGRVFYTWGEGLRDSGHISLVFS